MGAELTFWGVVKLVFTLLPDIISFIKKAVVFVNGQVDLAATKAKAATMLSAIGKAMETGDTSDVEAIFNPRPRA
jgi:hypothetical protein